MCVNWRQFPLLWSLAAVGALKTIQSGLENLLLLAEYNYWTFQKVPYIVCRIIDPINFFSVKFFFL